MYRAWAEGEGFLGELSLDALAEARAVGNVPTLAVALTARILTLVGSPPSTERQALIAELLAHAEELHDHALRREALYAHRVVCGLVADREGYDAGEGKWNALLAEIDHPRRAR